MHTGITIDGRDTYTDFGVRLLEGSLGSVVCWPPLKDSSVPVVAWHENHGLDADLSAPRLDSRRITLRLSSEGGYAGWRQFLSAVSRRGEREVYFRDLNKTFNLRPVQWGTYDYHERLGFVTLTLADDHPLDGYTYSLPSTSVEGSLPYRLPFRLGGELKEGDYAINGRSLNRYGVRLLKGSLNGLWSAGDARQPLVRNLPHFHGSEAYNGLARHYNTPTAVLTALLRADNATDMWLRWNALLYDIIRPGERILHGVPGEQSRKFYYKSCSVTEFAIDDLQGAWIKFNITVQPLDWLPVAEGYGLPYQLPFRLG